MDAYVQDGCWARQAEVDRVFVVLNSFPQTQAQVPGHAEASVVEASRVGAAAIRWSRKQARACPAVGCCV